MQGYFICVEGGNGAGKGTVLEGLKQYMESQMQAYVHTREPGGTELGEKVRAILLQSDPGSLYPLSEVLLFAAARHQHVMQVIKPNLDKGVHVLCDRYVDSSIAFQSCGQKTDRETVIKVNDIAMVGTLPHLTILLDIDPEVAAARIRARNGEKDKYEAYDLAFQMRVRVGYLTQAANEPHRYAVLDASLPPDELLQLCIETLKVKLAL